MTIWLAMWQAFSCISIALAITGVITAIVFAAFVHPKIAIPIGVIIFFGFCTAIIYASNTIVE